MLLFFPLLSVKFFLNMQRWNFSQWNYGSVSVSLFVRITETNLICARMYTFSKLYVLVQNSTRGTLWEKKVFWLLYFKFGYSQHWLTLIRTTIMHFYDSLMLSLQHSLAVTCATRCRDFFFAHFFFLNLYKKRKMCV